MWEAFASVFTILVDLLRFWKGSLAILLLSSHSKIFLCTDRGFYRFDIFTSAFPSRWQLLFREEEGEG